MLVPYKIKNVIKSILQNWDHTVKNHYDRNGKKKMLYFATYFNVDVMERNKSFVLSWTHKSGSHQKRIDNLSRSNVITDLQMLLTVVL